MKVRAKFRCLSVEDFGDHKKATLGAVMDDSEENKSFAKYTPSGTLHIGIDGDAPAAAFFKPKKEYYLLFEEIEKE